MAFSAVYALAHMLSWWHGHMDMVYALAGRKLKACCWLKTSWIMRFWKCLVGTWDGEIIDLYVYSVLRCE